MHVLLAAALLLGTLMASPARAATVVYVGNAESNEIYVLQLDRQSGDLTVVEKVPIPGITKPGISTPMSVSPDRRFLYVGTRGEPKLAVGFAIDSASGRLKHVASGPLADSMAYIATDRTGRFLLGASYPGHKLTVNPIGPPGTVQPPHQVLTDHPNAHSILADASNRHVLALTLGNDLVNVFRFDGATGMLAPATPPSARVKEKAGPRHFAFHPNGIAASSSSSRSIRWARTRTGSRSSTFPDTESGGIAWRLTACTWSGWTWRTITRRPSTRSMTRSTSPISAP